jgi:iron complex outermembrane receptor protein
VQVLNNGLDSLDFAAASADHNNAMEPFLAERIEVLQGPQTLFYGSGASGGVVNVISGRIPTELGLDQKALASRYDSASAQGVVMGKADGSQGQWAWHVDGLYRHSDDIKIPDWALEPQAIEAEEAYLHSLNALEGEDGHEEEEEEAHGQPSPQGLLGNSQTQAHSLSFGTSWVRPEGYWGLAVNQLHNEYGLPPGTHAHHHHEHEEGVAEEEEEADVQVRLDMQQTRIELAGEESISWAGFDRFSAQAVSSDYQHTELENHTPGTRFDNQGQVVRLNLKQTRADALQLGLHWQAQDQTVRGEEAYLPDSQSQNIALLALKDWQVERWTLGLGARMEQQRQSLNACQRQDDTHNLSAQALWQYSEDSNTYLSLNQFNRAPRVEERFSNHLNPGCTLAENPEAWVLHAATGRIELGHAELKNEAAAQLEWGWRRHQGAVLAEVNLFYSRYQDYIYLGDSAVFEGARVARYQQEDADVYGGEAQVTLPLGNLARGHWDLSLNADYLRAELASGAHLPRQPSPRLGLGLEYSQDHWQLSSRWQHSLQQEHLAPGEQPSAAYTRWDLSADYHLGTWQVYIQAKNLLNETIRDASAPLKWYAPDAGRSLEVGVRWGF